jgi:hypothetical protein
VAKSLGLGGYQPPTYSDSARRADFDLQRRVAFLEANGGGGGGIVITGTYSGTTTPLPVAAGIGEAWIIGTPVPTAAPKRSDGTNAQTGDIMQWNGTTWINLGAQGGGTDEVWIGTSDPIAANPTIELWYDSDATAPPTGGPLAYVHNQGAASAAWTIPHNLGWYPNVTIQDSSGSTVEGEIVYSNPNTITVTFSAAFAGVAYLS